VGKLGRLYLFMVRYIMNLLIESATEAADISCSPTHP